MMAGMGFPRLYAAASLKQGVDLAVLNGISVFSAALCRGLIEATPARELLYPTIGVFRGFMPRPH